jgi:hypothetical protein
MFTKLAALPGDRRRRAAPVTPVHCNDNQSGRPLAAVPRRAKRQTLLCRWRLDPSTGRLECRLQIESAGETSAEELPPMRKIRRRAVGGRRALVRGPTPRRTTKTAES